MKKALCMLGLGLMLATSAAAIEFDLGVRYGLRTVTDPAIKTVYGNGTIFFPYAAVNVWKGLTIGAGYETGYSAAGPIGIFEEDSTLKVNGFEVFAAYQYPIGQFVPYVSVGYGSFSYTQTIDSPYATEKIDASKSTFIFAGGAKYYLLDGLFLGAEIKYVPLTVKPLEDSVDLGGLRLTIGVGYTIKVRKVPAQG
jgi:opacity protein-like surface antigen